MPSTTRAQSLTGAVVKSILGNNSLIDTSLCAAGSTLSVYSTILKMVPYSSSSSSSDYTYSDITDADASAQGITYDEKDGVYTIPIITGVIVCDAGVSPSIPGGTWSDTCRQACCRCHGYYYLGICSTY